MLFIEEVAAQLRFLGLIEKLRLKLPRKSKVLEKWICKEEKNEPEQL